VLPLSNYYMNKIILMFLFANQSLTSSQLRKLVLSKGYTGFRLKINLRYLMKQRMVKVDRVIIEQSTVVKNILLNRGDVLTIAPTTRSNIDAALNNGGELSQCIPECEPINSIKGYPETLTTEELITMYTKGLFACKLPARKKRATNPIRLISTTERRTLRLSKKQMRTEVDTASQSGVVSAPSPASALAAAFGIRKPSHWRGELC
jgi:hypothetical protein